MAGPPRTSVQRGHVVHVLVEPLLPSASVQHGWWEALRRSAWLGASDAMPAQYLLVAVAAVALHVKLCAERVNIPRMIKLM